jgi:single-strand DNA-binding protein
MNCCIFVGRLASDVDFKDLGDKQKATFRLAVRKRFVKEGELDADFLTCIAWNATAKFVNQYFKKGDGIAVQTEYHVRKYNHNNVDREAHEFVVNTVDFAGTKNNGNNNKSAGNYKSKPNYSVPQKPQIQTLPPDINVPF